jgi:6-pyruvoyltetrahydropterin/6-carboxytetrahydropterin synthase
MSEQPATHISLMRVFEWDMAHRLMGHEGKCRFIHGHRYRAEIHLRSDKLDQCGRVIDFHQIKESIGRWIDEYWDHALMLFAGDSEVLKALHTLQDSVQQRITLLPENPTAENIASHLLWIICPKCLIGTGVHAYRVVVWETPSCYAQASIDE